MPRDDRQHVGSADRRDFATTQWSIVFAAGNREHQRTREALRQLCEAYWPPLYAYARRRVSDASEAQDLTQAFFAELLEKEYVAAALPERGRFRAFLLTAFKHFLSKQWEKARAQKRGGGQALLSLDFATADSTLCLEPATTLTPEQIFDRQWAVTLLGQVLHRLEAELTGAGKAEQFDKLRGYLVGDRAGTTYAQTAEALGMTEAAAKQAASRMRRRYRELLREAIAQTVAAPEDVDDEIRDLFTLLES